MSEAVNRIAVFLSDEVAGDFVFDGNDHGTAPQFYEAKAAELLQLLESSGWRPPGPANAKAEGPG